MLVSLLKRTNYNNKFTEIENKILSISGLATNAALTAVENKISNISSLVKKIDYNTKIPEIENKLTDENHDKYITTPELNTLAAGVFNARLAQADLVAKAEFHAKLKSLNKKNNSNKTKHLLVENELKKLKSFDLGYLIGKSYFDGDVSQNYLMFQPILKYFALGSSWITEWKSKGQSNESLKVPSKTDNTLTPTINWFDGDKTRLRFAARCLIQSKITYNHGKIVNIYIVYEIINAYRNENYPTLENALFGAVKLTKDTGINNYKYSGYGIGFYGRGIHPDGGTGKNAVIFAVDMSSSTKIGNKKKDILILGKGPTQRLGKHSLISEKCIGLVLPKNYTKFCLSLHYNGENSYLFVNGTEIHECKVKDSEIVPNILCLGNVSKDFSEGSMNKTGFSYIYDFSVDYDAVAVDDIWIIHKYLMKKNDIA